MGRQAILFFPRHDSEKPRKLKISDQSATQRIESRLRPRPRPRILLADNNTPMRSSCVGVSLCPQSAILLKKRQTPPAAICLAKFPDNSLYHACEFPEFVWRQSCSCQNAAFEGGDIRSDFLRRFLCSVWVFDVCLSSLCVTRKVKLSLEEHIWLSFGFVLKKLCTLSTCWFDFTNHLEPQTGPSDSCCGLFFESHLQNFCIECCWQHKPQSVEFCHFANH